MSITLSRNEIRAEVEKAIRGAGANWGQAKDGGVMAVFLAGHGLPFLGSVTRCLDHYQSADKADVMLAPLDGMMIAEFVAGQSQDQSQEVSWSGEVMAVRFLIAAIGIVSAEQDLSLTLYDEAGVVAVADHGQMYLRADDASIKNDRKVTIAKQRGSKDGLVECHWSGETAVTASQNCWVKLGGYAFKTYVEETEEKRRAGAGAGDIDNT